MSDPSISVIIPSRNGAARLGETLRSLAAEQAPASVETIVVDDGSDDATSEIAASADLPWGAVRVLRHDAPRGRAAACNLGVASAVGELILILDDDMTLRSGAIEAHRSFHRAQSDAAARGRMVQATVEPASCFRRFLAREAAGEERRLLASRVDLPFALCQTGHFSIRKSTFLEAGGFDASITRYGFEDIELGFRLAARGVRLVYLPEAESLHRAYIDELDRYLERHREAGVVARQLAGRYPEGPFRAYLRVDAPTGLGVGRDPAGLVALRASNRLLLQRAVRRALGSRRGFAAIRLALRAAESLRLERMAHFGYHVARDIRYFQGYFGETE